MKIAVPQVVADGQLMLAHLGQHGSDRMTKRVPTDSDDANGLERRLDFPLQHGSQIQRLGALESLRRKYKVLRAVVKAAETAALELGMGDGLGRIKWRAP